MECSIVGMFKDFKSLGLFLFSWLVFFFLEKTCFMFDTLENKTAWV